ncbi:MAG: outer membrane beta-barrel protein [Bacteroidales bacterium]
MRKLIIMTALLLTSSALTLTSQTFEKGTNLIKVGVGFANKQYNLPISLGYERGIITFDNSDMSIGVGGRFTASWDEDVNEDGVTYDSTSSSHYIVSALANWHYTGFGRWDLYAGGSVGCDFASRTEDFRGGYHTYFNTDGTQGVKRGRHDFSANWCNFVYGITIGARYEITDIWSLYAEGGYDISYISVGTAFRF